MTESTFPTNGTPQFQSASAPSTKRRSRAGLWWGLGAGVVILGVAAAIVIPRVLHAQRVNTYQDLVAQVNAIAAETTEATYEADQFTVLYGLQLPEVAALAEELNAFAELSDHYFTDELREEFAANAETLRAAATQDLLSDDAAQLVSAAQTQITEDGLLWQTDFLNLDIRATEALIVRPEPPIMPLEADADVTKELVVETQQALAVAASQLVQADDTKDAAVDRSAELLETVAGTLVPLTTAANNAPGQAEIMIDMYPDADADVMQELRDAAQFAEGSVTAEQFTVADELVVPIHGETPEDTPVFTSTDAWRVVIIASHLTVYSDGITAAWITDAGSIEEALGVTPGLPFFYW